MQQLRVAAELAKETIGDPVPSEDTEVWEEESPSKIVGKGLGGSQNVASVHAPLRTATDVKRDETYPSIYTSGDYLVVRKSLG